MIFSSFFSLSGWILVRKPKHRRSEWSTRTVYKLTLRIAWLWHQEPQFLPPPALGCFHRCDNYTTARINAKAILTLEDTFGPRLAVNHCHGNPYKAIFTSTGSCKLYRPHSQTSNSRETFRRPCWHGFGVLSFQRLSFTAAGEIFPMIFSLPRACRVDFQVHLISESNSHKTILRRLDTGRTSKAV